MKMRANSTGLMAIATLAVSACAGMAPDVPAPLRPASDQVLFLEAFATGVQIYECAAKAGQPTAFEWVFRVPEATLRDRAGSLLGKHYAGPTWEAVDGSKVVGLVSEHVGGPTPSAIPWLLLTAKSTEGTGVLSATKSVQRVDTVGGVAPHDRCDTANVGQVVRVPYTASYYFYRARRPGVS